MSDDTVWLKAVLAEFDEFLIDHAANERKASASAMSLVAHYPDRRELVTRLIELAIEELNHFREVNQILHNRGLALTRDVRDPYVHALRARIRQGKEEYFLDQLLLAGVIEARGATRFGLLAQAEVLEPSLQRFYQALAASEQRHCKLFLSLAHTSFAPSEVSRRHTQWMHIEQEIAHALPPGPRLH